MNLCNILCSPLIRKKDCVPMKMLQRKLCLAMEAGQVGKCSFMFVFNYINYNYWISYCTSRYSLLVAKSLRK